MEFDENLNPIEPPIEPDWKQTPPPTSPSFNYQQPTPPDPLRPQTPPPAPEVAPSWQPPVPPKPPVAPPPPFMPPKPKPMANGNIAKRFMDLLTIVVLIGVVIGVIGFFANLGNRSNTATTPANQQGLTVTGEGMAYVTPDVAKIDFGVSTEAKNLADSQKANSEAIAKIKDALQAYNIEAKDIKTLYYTINPEYNYINNRAPVLRGYTTRHTVRVTVRKLEDSDSVVQTLGTAGATEISQVQFTIDDPSDVQKEAREKAIDAAKEKAKQLANLSGAKLGRIISINESTPDTSNPAPKYAEGMGGGGSGIGLEEGSMAITSNVTLTYSLT